MNVVILGRTIGTASGWDQVDDQCLFFYDFKSNGKTVLTDCDVQWDYNTGMIEQIEYDEDGVPLVVRYSGDIVELLKDVEKD